MQVSPPDSVHRSVINWHSKQPWGAAQLLAAVPETPETHRDWVSSPGGTTLAGLAVMNRKDFRSTLVETVVAARDRSIELSKM
ncbi:MAG: hypothetical protein LR015_09590 [Verrucomicrobia bacterium]|nr:hypothetical protein [Verrucomicrobiota bacterium]